MAYFDDVGTTTQIAAGETHHWVYGWGDSRRGVMAIAGPALDRNGSAGAVVWATKQGKRFRIDNGPFRHEFHVTIHSDGPETALYNLQVVSFP